MKGGVNSGRRRQDWSKEKVICCRSQLHSQEKCQELRFIVTALPEFNLEGFCGGSCPHNINLEIQFYVGVILDCIKINLEEPKVPNFHALRPPPPDSILYTFSQKSKTLLFMKLTGHTPVCAGCEGDSRVVPGRCSPLQAGIADHCKEMELTLQTAPH